MKIDAVKIYRYSLKLKNPLTLKDIVIAFREGLVIKLQSGDYTAWGEIAPLPGFSHEDLQKAIKDSLLLQSSLTGSEIPTKILPLDKAFEKWLDKYNLSKSVRFGFETAILHLIAQSKKTDFISLLNNKFIPLVKINGLLIGDRTAVLQKAQSLCEIEYTAFKLKVGRESIKTEIETIRKVREIIGDNSVLRLDANRSFNLNQALLFSNEASKYNIDYIEEPVLNYHDLIKFINENNPAIPVALDETLLEINPDSLKSLPSVKAIVIKPTLLGLENALRFVRIAKVNNITPAISSTFESSLGIAILTLVAASVNNIDIPAGLDTLDWFDEDITAKQLPINYGKIKISDCYEIINKINPDYLEEITNE